MPLGGSHPSLLIDFLGHGSLKDLLGVVFKGGSYNGWNHTAITTIIVGILCGMRAIHEGKIMHHDLKPILASRAS